MMPGKEGLFNAYPVEIGLGETKENKLLQVVIKYHLFEEVTAAEPVDCSGENFEISGYHILEKRDHSLNQTTIDALKAALGWDGADPFWLQDNAAALAQRVQVKLVAEEYNGRASLKVAFLNPYGAKGGGVPKADDDLRRAVTNRLGPKFRALSGGTAAPAPKPAGKPVLPKTAPPTATAPTPAPATMEQAWAAFATRCSPPDWDQEATAAEWFRVLATLFPGQQSTELTPVEWGRMRDEGPGMVLPF